MAKTEPIRDKEQIKALADYFLNRNQIRNYVLLIMGIYTAARISDLLTLRWSDVYNQTGQCFRRHLILSEHKTGKRRAIALNDKVIDALKLYLPHRKSEYIFDNGRGEPLSRVQAWRIMNDATAEIGLEETVACHGLRKTWGYHAWTSQAVSPVVIMDVYNHSSYDITKRYLGVEQDDLDKAYLEMKLC